MDRRTREHGLQTAMTAAPPPAGARFIPVRPEWLARRVEPALEPHLPIIDAHHHLWDRPGWRYLLDEFLQDLGGGHDIRATVHVQARSMYRKDGPEAFRPIGETEFAVGVAAMSASGVYGRSRVCSAIVGFADLSLGSAVTEVLEAQIAAGGGRFRGVRHMLAYDDDPAMVSSGNPAPRDLMRDPKFIEGFGALAPLGLSFEAWLYHRQLDDLCALADAHPETQIVVNHMGGPLGVGGYADRKAEVFSVWAQGVRNLALRPNVFIKLGGLGMAVSGFGFERRLEPPTSEELCKAWLPYVEICIDAFGPERAMFESNFPVDKGSYSYGVFWNACKRMTQGMDPSSRAKLFYGAAAKVYGLPPLENEIST